MADISEPCPWCTCPPAQHDGHVCTDYECRLSVTTEQAVRALAATTDGSLLGDEHDLEDLFAAGVIRTERDFCDEYLTVLTRLGREAIQRLLATLDPEADA